MDNLQFTINRQAKTQVSNSNPINHNNHNNSMDYSSSKGWPRPKDSMGVIRRVNLYFRSPRKDCIQLRSSRKDGMQHRSNRKNLPRPQCIMHLESSLGKGKRPRLLLLQTTATSLSLLTIHSLRHVLLKAAPGVGGSSI